MASSPGKPGTGKQSLAQRLLLACGAIGPLFFIVTFLIEGATRPHYSAWHHYVSSLSLGELGWMQVANFLICGTLVFCFSFGLRRALYPGRGALWGPILLGAFGVGLIGAGLFPTDPLLNFPPGSPDILTLQGTLHNLFSLLAFASLIAACVVLARRFAGDPAWRGWASYSIVAGIVVLVFFVLADVAASPNPGAPAGFFQRISIITGWTWVALVALRLRSRGIQAGR